MQRGSSLSLTVTRKAGTSGICLCLPAWRHPAYRRQWNERGEARGLSLGCYYASGRKYGGDPPLSYPAHISQFADPLVAHRAYDLGLMGFPLLFKLASHKDETAQNAERDAPSARMVGRGLLALSK